MRLTLCAASILALSACAHGTSVEMERAWKAPPRSRFFLVGTSQVEKTPASVMPQVLGGIRGGLWELGHSARTGFETPAVAREAMKRADCDDRCVLLEVRLTALDRGGKVGRQLLGTAGGLGLALELAVSSVDGEPLDTGIVDAVPYRNDERAQLALHVVPTIGPAVAQAISEIAEPAVEEEEED